MNPRCHRCNKAVYPVEKLNCLDKYWHKGCFNCEVCHMTLSMKTYKGYNKLPYCNTHYPTTKFTAVADTPENLRLKKNTESQSNVVYHKTFKEEMGNYTAIADNPELLRTQKCQQQASDLAYQQKGGQQAQPPRLPQTDAVSSPASAPEPEPVPEPVSKDVRYIAIYDYTAADDDEVTFQEGDIIVNGEIIDEGWMSGKVKRTGQSGMLPSNYVELVQ